MLDVARLAGVSKTTVSFVINHRPASGISPSTRARVLAAVEQLGYRPHRAAANLRLRRTHTIGLHVSPEMLDRSERHALALLSPLIRAADNVGYQVLTFTDNGDPVQRISELEQAQAVDGFVLTDISPNDPRARHLAEVGAPFAAMGRLDHDLPGSWFDIDNVAAVHLALDHLYQAGRRHIALVLPDAPGYWWDERVAGYRDWLADHDLALREDWIVRTPWPAIQAAVARLLAGHPPPDGILAAGDSVSVPTYRAVTAANLTVGDDVAVVGFSPHLWMLDPPLTTLRVPFDQMAEQLVASILQQLLWIEPPESTGTIVPVDLVLGRSA